MMNSKGIVFHIAGIICIIWFLIRVVPKPDRITYPCQQISKSIAVGYIAFWSVLWGSLFFGLGLWVKRVKLKTTAFLPVILTVFVLIFSVTSNIYAETYIDEKNEIEIWEPIPNQPIGTPRGVNPGRVTWVWDPDATESELTGFWWYKENNNQEPLDEMMLKGIKGLAEINNEEEAWNALFKHFNKNHGNGEIGYQTGEKIAIKVNLNNCEQLLGYIKTDNDRDANPYVVKALLRQLVNVVGVKQEDITVYDASRKMPNWFYNRVYYESYPSLSLIPEFPDVHYVDSTGGARGREKVKSSSEKIYFADETGLYRTLPICVVEAKYLINMPILKRHPLNQGVTFSGKNFFGTWIGSVQEVHDYHFSGFTEGNPAPQTDLLAHEHIGGKTLLFIGDGTYATKEDHSTIAKFQMYPFNNDWTNSLFLSQDPVAVDSVMYDFLHAEGTNPCEGSQNYLHQSAEPLLDKYDPENDGIFLDYSLGVHEHWNKTIDIFSSDRYSGSNGGGIDFLLIYDEQETRSIKITKPAVNYLYFNDKPIIRTRNSIVIGSINVEVEINSGTNNVEKVGFYIDNELMSSVSEIPYTWEWSEPTNSRYNLKVVAFFDDEKTFSDEITVWKIA